MTLPRSAGRRVSDATTRETPNNPEAEKSVIGAILIDNAAYVQVSSQLETAHFFADRFRKMYECIGAIVDRGGIADIVTVKEELGRRELPSGETWLEDVGGPAYIASLVDGVPRSTHAKAYAAVVREKSTLRRLIALGGKLIKHGHANDADSREILAQTDLALTDIASGAKLATGASPIADDLSSLMDDLDRRVSHKGQVSGLPTGYPDLDLLTHGWQKRHMVVIAGQTSFGKSVLALNLAHAIARRGHRVVYYSYEMERKELEYRLLSSIASIPLTRILWGALSDKEYAGLSHAMEEMHALPLEINDGASRSIADARSECRQIKADRGLAAVFFDHFQLMDGVDGENRTQQLGAVSRRIQSLGPELDVTTFALSQLTLAGAEASQEPHLEHLRECKQLGHDANQVFILHPHKMAEIRDEHQAPVMKLLCRKNRGGRLGKVWLTLERDYVRFSPTEEPKPSPKELKTPSEPKKMRTPAQW